jgi:hypothetical protein
VWFGHAQERLAPGYIDALVEKASDFREWADPHRVRLTCWFFGLPASALRVLVDGHSDSEYRTRVGRCSRIMMKSPSGRFLVSGGALLKSTIKWTPLQRPRPSMLIAIWRPANSWLVARISSPVPFSAWVRFSKRYWLTCQAPKPSPVRSSENDDFR